MTQSQTKIEAQTKSLQTLSAKWLDKLTNYVTTERAQPNDVVVTQLVDASRNCLMFSSLRYEVLTSRTGRHHEELITENINTYICLD